MWCTVRKKTLAIADDDGMYEEPQFVKEWVTALRGSSDPTVRSVGVLIRPHPERLKEWDEHVTLNVQKAGAG